MVLASLTGGAHATNILWSSPTATDWLTALNWTGGVVPTLADNAQLAVNPTGSGGVGINFHNPTNAGTQADGSRIEDVGSIELTSARTSGNPVIGNSSTTVGASGTLRLNGILVNSIPNVVLRNASSQNITLQNTQGTGTQTMAVVLGNATNNVVAIDGAGNIVISCAVSGSGSKLSVLGAGAGDLVLSGSNSFSGGIDVSGSGKLRVNGVASLPTTADVAVRQGGRLRFATAGSYGSNTQSISFTPNQTANAALDLQTSNIVVTFASNINLGADSRIESNGATGALTLSGNLSGAGTLIKQAGGNLSLSGTGNSLSGGTQIGNGTLSVGSASSMGTGALVLFQTSTNNTTLALNNAAQTVGSLSSQFTALTGTQTQVITLNGTALNVNQAVDGTYGTGAVATLTSTIVGPGSLTKSGPATLTLTSANTYSGPTTISAGTLKLAGAGSINNSSGIALAAGATFDVVFVSGYTLAQNLSAKDGGTALVSGAMNASGRSLDLRDGNNIGTLAVNLGSLVLSGSTLNFDLGGSATDCDSITLAVAPTLSGQQTINVATLNSLTSLPTPLHYTLVSGPQGSALNTTFSLASPTLTVGANTYNLSLGSSTDTAVVLTVTAAAPPPVITGAASASAFVTSYGTASPAQSFAVSGGNLTGDISATAPTGFEVSANGGLAYGPSATFTRSGGSASGTLYIRLSATAAVSGAYDSMSIVLTSAGAGDVSITTPASGNGVGKATPSVATWPSASSIAYGQTLAASTLLGGAATPTGGGFAFTTPATKPALGTTSQSVTYTPPDVANFTTASGTVSVTATPSYASWSESFFGAQTDPAIIGPAADPDHDGLTNQQEYAFGLDPTSGASCNPITAAVDASTGKFTYTRRDPALTGATYSIETSPTLGTAGWSADSTAEQTVTGTAGEVQSVEVTLSGSKPLVPAALFVRVLAHN